MRVTEETDSGEVSGVDETGVEETSGKGEADGVRDPSGERVGDGVRVTEETGAEEVSGVDKTVAGKTSREGEGDGVGGTSGVRRGAGAQAYGGRARVPTGTATGGRAAAAGARRAGRATRRVWTGRCRRRGARAVSSTHRCCRPGSRHGVGGAGGCVSSGERWADGPQLRGEAATERRLGVHSPWGLGRTDTRPSLRSEASSPRPVDPGPASNLFLRPGTPSPPRIVGVPGGPQRGASTRGRHRRAMAWPETTARHVVDALTSRAQPLGAGTA